MAKGTYDNATLVCTQRNTSYVWTASSRKFGAINLELQLVVCSTENEDLSISATSEDQIWSHCNCVNQFCVILSHSFLECWSVPGEEFACEATCQVSILIDSNASNFLFMLSLWEPSCLTSDVSRAYCPLFEVFGTDCCKVCFIFEGDFDNIPSVTLRFSDTSS